MHAYYQQEEGRPSFLWLLGNGSRFAVSVSSETPKDTHKTLANSLLLALAKKDTTGLSPSDNRRRKKTTTTSSAKVVSALLTGSLICGKEVCKIKVFVDVPCNNCWKCWPRIAVGRDSQTVESPTSSPRRGNDSVKF